MEISVISDSITTISTFSKLNFSIDAVAPPSVKPKSHVKTVPKRFTPKRRRLKRKSRTGADDNGDFWYSTNGRDFMSSDGNYYGGGGGGGGGGWGGGGSGGGDNNTGWNFNWDDSESNSYSDPAFDFVYEVLSWIVLSNCLHFAYKKVVRIVGEGFGETAREKVPIGLTSVC